MVSDATSRIYYDGFHRVDAIKYDDRWNTMQAERELLAFDPEHGYVHKEGRAIRAHWGCPDCGDRNVDWNPGQWLVKDRNGDLFVQDDEPVWVVRWLKGTPLDAAPGSGRRSRAPFLSNKWVGAWEEVFDA